MSSVALTEAEFVHLLGKGEDSPEFQDFVKSLAAKPTVETFEGERRYFTFAEHGLDVVFDEGRVASCHLVGPEGDSSFRPYGGPLPHGLSFANSRDTLVARLGQPSKSHPGREDPRPTVRIKPWMKFSFSTHALHVQFTPDGSRIELVTLLGPDRKK